MKKNTILLLCFTTLMIILTSGCSEKPVEVTLGQYFDLEVEYTETVVTDKMVENAIIDAIVANQDNVTITNRAVRNSDIVNINYLGKIDGVAFDGGTADEQTLEIGSGSFIDGFEDQVIGMKIGQTKDINVTFPDPYQNNPELAGAEAVFTVKVNGIEGKEIPTKITNAMIKEISETYTTVKEYREYIRSELEASAEETNLQNKQTAVWDIILANSKVITASNKKVKYYAKFFESEYQAYADMYGVDLTTLIQDYMGITVAEFNAEKKAFAQNSAENHAVFEAIANEQNITFSDEEYQTYIEENNISAEEKQQYAESIKDDLLYQKVIDLITSRTNFIVKK